MSCCQSWRENKMKEKHKIAMPAMLTEFHATTNTNSPRVHQCETNNRILNYYYVPTTFSTHTPSERGHGSRTRAEQRSSLLLSILCIACLLFITFARNIYCTDAIIRSNQDSALQRRKSNFITFAEASGFLLWERKRGNSPGSRPPEHAVNPSTTDIIVTNYRTVDDEAGEGGLLFSPSSASYVTSISDHSTGVELFTIRKQSFYYDLSIVVLPAFRQVVDDNGGLVRREYSCDPLFVFSEMKFPIIVDSFVGTVEFRKVSPMKPYCGVMQMSSTDASAPIQFIFPNSTVINIDPSVFHFNCSLIESCNLQSTDPVQGVRGGCMPAAASFEGTIGGANVSWPSGVAVVSAGTQYPQLLYPLDFIAWYSSHITAVQTSSSNARTRPSASSSLPPPIRTLFVSETEASETEADRQPKRGGNTKDIEPLRAHLWDGFFLPVLYADKKGAQAAVCAVVVVYTNGEVDIYDVSRSDESSSTGLVLLSKLQPPTDPKPPAPTTTNTAPPETTVIPPSNSTTANDSDDDSSIPSLLPEKAVLSSTRTNGAFACYPHVDIFSKPYPQVYVSAQQVSKSTKDGAALPPAPIAGVVYSSVVSITCGDGRGWLYDLLLSPNATAKDNLSPTAIIAQAALTGSFTLPQPFIDAARAFRRGATGELAVDVQISLIQPTIAYTQFNNITDSDGVPYPRGTPPPRDSKRGFKQQGHAADSNNLNLRDNGDDIPSDKDVITAPAAPSAAFQYVVAIAATYLREGIDYHQDMFDEDASTVVLSMQTFISSVGNSTWGCLVNEGEGAAATMTSPYDYLIVNLSSSGDEPYTTTVNAPPSVLAVNHSVANVSRIFNTIGWVVAQAAPAVADTDVAASGSIDVDANTFNPRIYTGPLVNDDALVEAAIFNASANAVEKLSRWLVRYGLVYSVVTSHYHLLLNVTDGRLAQSARDLTTSPHEYNKKNASIDKFDDPPTDGGNSSFLSFFEYLYGNAFVSGPVRLDPYTSSKRVEPLMDWDASPGHKHSGGGGGEGGGGGGSVVGQSALRAWFADGLLTSPRLGVADPVTCVYAALQPVGLLDATTLQANIYLTLKVRPKLVPKPTLAPVNTSLSSPPDRVAAPADSLSSTSTTSTDGSAPAPFPTVVAVASADIYAVRWFEQPSTLCLNAYTQNFCIDIPSIYDGVKTNLVPDRDTFLISQSTKPANGNWTTSISANIVRGVIASSTQKSFFLQTSPTPDPNATKEPITITNPMGTPMSYVCANSTLYAYYSSVGNLYWSISLKNIPGCHDCVCNDYPEALSVSDDRKLIALLVNSNARRDAENRGDDDGGDDGDEVLSNDLLIIDALTGFIYRHASSRDIADMAQSECTLSRFQPLEMEAVIERVDRFDDFAYLAMASLIDSRCFLVVYLPLADAKNVSNVQFKILFHRGEWSTYCGIITFTDTTMIITLGSYDSDDTLSSLESAHNVGLSEEAAQKRRYSQWIDLSDEGADESTLQRRQAARRNRLRSRNGKQRRDRRREVQRRNKRLRSQSEGAPGINIDIPFETSIVFFEISQITSLLALDWTAIAIPSLFTTYNVLDSETYGGSLYLAQLQHNTSSSDPSKNFSQYSVVFSRFVLQESLKPLYSVNLGSITVEDTYFVSVFPFISKIANESGTLICVASGPLTCIPYDTRYITKEIVTAWSFPAEPTPHFCRPAMNMDAIMVFACDPYLVHALSFATKKPTFAWQSISWPGKFNKTLVDRGLTHNDSFVTMNIDDKSCADPRISGELVIMVCLPVRGTATNSFLFLFMVHANDGRMILSNGPWAQTGATFSDDGLLVTYVNNLRTAITLSLFGVPQVTPFRYISLMCVSEDDASYVFFVNTNIDTGLPFGGIMARRTPFNPADPVGVVTRTYIGPVLSTLERMWDGTLVGQTYRIVNSSLIMKVLWDALAPSVRAERFINLFVVSGRVVLMDDGFLYPLMDPRRCDTCAVSCPSYCTLDLVSGRQYLKFITQYFVLAYVKEPGSDYFSDSTPLILSTVYMGNMTLTKQYDLYERRSFEQLVPCRNDSTSASKTSVARRARFCEMIPRSQSKSWVVVEVAENGLYGNAIQYTGTRGGGLFSGVPLWTYTPIFKVGTQLGLSSLLNLAISRESFPSSLPDGSPFKEVTNVFLLEALNNTQLTVQTDTAKSFQLSTAACEGIAEDIPPCQGQNFSFSEDVVDESFLTVTWKGANDSNWGEGFLSTNFIAQVSELARLPRKGPPQLCGIDNTSLCPTQCVPTASCPSLIRASVADYLYAVSWLPHLSAPAMVAIEAASTCLLQYYADKGNTTNSAGNSSALTAVDQHRRDTDDEDDWVDMMDEVATVNEWQRALQALKDQSEQSDVVALLSRECDDVAPNDIYRFLSPCIWMVCTKDNRILMMSRPSSLIAKAVGSTTQNLVLAELPANEKIEHMGVTFQCSKCVFFILKGVIAEPAAWLVLGSVKSLIVVMLFYWVQERIKYRQWVRHEFTLRIKRIEKFEKDISIRLRAHELVERHSERVAKLRALKIKEAKDRTKEEEEVARNGSVQVHGSGTATTGTHLNPKASTVTFAHQPSAAQLTAAVANTNAAFSSSGGGGDSSAGVASFYNDISVSQQELIQHSIRNSSFLFLPYADGAGVMPGDNVADHQSSTERMDLLEGVRLTMSNTVRPSDFEQYLVTPAMRESALEISEMGETERATDKHELRKELELTRLNLKQEKEAFEKSEASRTWITKLLPNPMSGYGTVLASIGMFRRGAPRQQMALRIRDNFLTKNFDKKSLIDMLIAVIGADPDDPENVERITAFAHFYQCNLCDNRQWVVREYVNEWDTTADEVITAMELELEGVHARLRTVCWWFVKSFEEMGFVKASKSTAAASNRAREDSDGNRGDRNPYDDTRQQPYTRIRPEARENENDKHALLNASAAVKRVSGLSNAAFVPSNNSSTADLMGGRQRTRIYSSTPHIAVDAQGNAIQTRGIGVTTSRRFVDLVMHNDDPALVIQSERSRLFVSEEKAVEERLRQQAADYERFAKHNNKKELATDDRNRALSLAIEHGLIASTRGSAYDMQLQEANTNIRHHNRDNNDDADDEDAQRDDVVKITVNAPTEPQFAAQRSPTSPYAPSSSSTRAYPDATNGTTSSAQQPAEGAGATTATINVDMKQREQEARRILNTFQGVDGLVPLQGSSLLGAGSAFQSLFGGVGSMANTSPSSRVRLGSSNQNNNQHAPPQPNEAFLQQRSELQPVVPASGGKLRTLLKKFFGSEPPPRKTHKKKNRIDYYDDDDSSSSVNDDTFSETSEHSVANSATGYEHRSATTDSRTSVRQRLANTRSAIDTRERAAKQQLARGDLMNDSATLRETHSATNSLTNAGVSSSTQQSKEASPEQKEQFYRKQILDALGDAAATDGSSTASPRDPSPSNPGNGTASKTKKRKKVSASSRGNSELLSGNSDISIHRHHYPADGDDEAASESGGELPLRSSRAAMAKSGYSSNNATRATSARTVTALAELEAAVKAFNKCHETKPQCFERASLPTRKIDETLQPSSILSLFSVLLAIVTILVYSFDVMRRSRNADGSYQLSSFDTYQCIFFMVFNSSFPSSLIVNTFAHADLGRETRMSTWRSKVGDILTHPFVQVSLFILAPPIITHVIPGFFAYIWVTGPIVGFSVLLEWYLRTRFTVPSVPLLFARFVTRVLVLFSVTVVFSLSFNYSVTFIWSQNEYYRTGSYGPRPYIGSIVDDYNSRSLNCMLEHMMDTISNFFQMGFLVL